MAILKVARMGHPVLRAAADPVPEATIRSPDFQRLVDDMIETMREYDGAGLAAPQVHHAVRMAVVESHRNPRYPDAPEFPLSVLVNPKVTPLTQETVAWWEGCLSIPEIRGEVHRPRAVRVEALDRHGKPATFTAEDFAAVVVQHEADHLDGILFLDRMKDLKRLAFAREYERYFLPAEEERGPAREGP